MGKVAGITAMTELVAALTMTKGLAFFLPHFWVVVAVSSAAAGVLSQFAPLLTRQYREFTRRGEEARERQAALDGQREPYRDYSTSSQSQQQRQTQRERERQGDEDESDEERQEREERERYERQEAEERARFRQQGAAVRGFVCAS